jgi:hypothetical protein
VILWGKKDKLLSYGIDCLLTFWSQLDELLAIQKELKIN